MKLFLLKPIKLPKDRNPWWPWYDNAFGFVVRAEDEGAARQFASENAGTEETSGFGNPWLSWRYSTCVELTSDGEAGIIIRDFASA